MQAEVIVEEGDGDRKDDQVGDQEDQHEQVPVESANKTDCRKIVI